MDDEGAGCGGGTEKRARSWGSVSRIRDVISGVERRAFVNIFGGGNLGGVRRGIWGEREIGLTGEWQLIRRRGQSARDVVLRETFWPVYRWGRLSHSICLCPDVGSGLGVVGNTRCRHTDRDVLPESTAWCVPENTGPNIPARTPL